MAIFSVPYGKEHQSFCLPEAVQPELVVAPDIPGAPDPIGMVEAALAALVGDVSLARFRNARSAAIAINDKTRPVPHRHLLPPLLRRLGDLGLADEAIRLIIATGAHAPMLPEEFSSVVPEEILARYRVLCHDADDGENLLSFGTTSRGTPVWINRQFAAVDLRIVVGNIEPHQFQGFSGGAKSAAIGLAGRETVDRNHAMMLDPRARLGHYADNPTRQDAEEIGRRIGVHFALNAVLNGHKEIVHAIAGEPVAVMAAGIPLSRKVCGVTVAAPFDLVVASAGGHPKDINLYQAQKALLHAGQVVRDGGTVILAAACPEGVGSQNYEEWMEGVNSHQEVFARFEREPFRVGPHKAFLMSRDAARLRVFLVSAMPPDFVRRFLLRPAASVEEALDVALADLPAGARVGIMPRASSTIPFVAQPGATR